MFPKMLTLFRCQKGSGAKVERGRTRRKKALDRVGGPPIMLPFLVHRKRL